MSILGNNESSQSERTTRAEIKLACEIRQGASPWIRVTLHDISPSGFRIDWWPGMSDHQPLSIRIPGLQPLSAFIRWKRENWMGCEFSSPLYGPIYDHIVRLSQA